MTIRININDFGKVVDMDKVLSISLIDGEVVIETSGDEQILCDGKPTKSLCKKCTERGFCSLQRTANIEVYSNSKCLSGNCSGCKGCDSLIN